MKKATIYLTILLLADVLTAQTLIAISNHHDATANHNQRKIVRDSADNIYVVYQDIVDEDTLIKSVYLNSETQEWGQPVVITEGKNPTLAISKECKFFLVYESDEAIPRIIYRSSEDFNIWTDEIILSDSEYACKTPVSDVDCNGCLNVFWINIGGDYAEYTCVENDTIYSTFSSLEYFAEVKDIAIANHLRYDNMRMFFAVQIADDNNSPYIEVYSTENKMQTFEMEDVFVTGKTPSITYNTYFDGYEDAVKILYLNAQNKLFEAISIFDNDVLSFTFRQTQDGIVNYYCIDDLAPPIGNSYIFMQNNNLYHSFSYGFAGWFDDYEHGLFYDYDIILDTISSNPYNPSIAYKHFRFSVVDFIWTEEHDGQYYIYYKRDDKYDPLQPNTISDICHNQITASPNPFIDKITFDFSTLNSESEITISIYDDNSKLVHEKTTTQNNYIWNGIDLNGNTVLPGIYVVLIITENQKIAGKIIKK
jgi:hypothetical protein